MSLTQEYIGNNRYHDEQYYSFYNTTISDSLAPETIWRLNNVRLHFSTAFASVEYLKLYISAAYGSAYNYTIYSANMLNVQDLLINFSHPLQFVSDDQLVVSLSNSGGVVVGLLCDVWAVRG